MGGPGGYVGYSMRPPPSHRFPPLPDVLKYGIEAFRAVWKPLLVIAAVTVGFGTVISLVTTATATNRLVYFDEGEFSFPADSAVWFGVGLIVGALLSLFGYLASSWLVLDYHDRVGSVGGNPIPQLEFGDAGRALSHSIGLFPRWLGWVIATATPIVALVVVIFGVPSYLFFNSGDDDVMVLALVWSVLLVFGAVLLVVPLSLFLGVRWFAFFGFAVIDRSGSPFRRASNVSRGQFWVTLGYLLVLFIIIGAISVLVENGSSFASFAMLGFGLSGNTGLSAVANTVSGTISIVSAVATFLLTTGFGGSCLALLYRTANPPVAGADLGLPGSGDAPRERPHSIISKA